MSDADAAVHDMTQMFLRAVDAAQPAQFMAQALPLLEADFHRLARTDAGRLVIGGFGKASAAMAQAFEQVIPPALLSRTEGMIIVPDGHEVDTSIELSGLNLRDLAFSKPRADTLSNKP